MDQAAHTQIISGLRTKLRDILPHDLVNRYRGVMRQVKRRSEGEAILLRKYARIHGKPLNLTNPQTYTEKLFWRMITWNRGEMPPRFRELADKYAVRAYVASTVGSDYLIPLLWHGEDPRQIPFERLRTKCVIKPSHASEQVIVVDEPPDRVDIIRKVSGWLAEDYYWRGREYQYYQVKPRIMIEECLTDQDGSLPLDYKIYCFNGTPELIWIRNHAHDISPFFDSVWNLLELSCEEGAARPWIPKPTNLDEMIAVAAKLSAGFGHVRVDLYNIKNRVYFGELTFTTKAGQLKFAPDYWDMKLGEKWDLSLDR